VAGTRNESLGRAHPSHVTSGGFSVATPAARTGLLGRAPDWAGSPTDEASVPTDEASVPTDLLRAPCHLEVMIPARDEARRLPCALRRTV